MSAKISGDGCEEEKEEGVAWGGEEEVEGVKEEEEEEVEEGEGEEGGIRRETARERRQSRRQSSKDTLKQLCAYSGLPQQYLSHLSTCWSDTISSHFPAIHVIILFLQSYY